MSTMPRRFAAALVAGAVALVPGAAVAAPQPGLGLEPRLVGLPESEHFEARRVGTRSEGRVFTVRNEGVLPLDIDDVTLGSAVPADWAVATDCAGATLLPGATCAVEVVFAPTAAGFRQALISIHDNAGSPHETRLSGQATDGYFLVNVFGEVAAFGDAIRRGDLRGLALDHPVLGMAVTPSGEGYWLVDAGGRVYAFGDAVLYGSAEPLALREPVVAMSATPTGRGYWLAAADGGVFAFGDARHHGSAAGALTPDGFVIGMASTPSGDGYWLIDDFGGVYAFGDAVLHGSLAAGALGEPIVGIAPTPSGKGYWLLDAGGGVYRFGDATFAGRPAEAGPDVPYVAIEGVPGGGYWISALDGQVWHFGSPESPAVPPGYRLEFVIDIAGTARSFVPGAGAGQVHKHGSAGVRPPPLPLPQAPPPETPPGAPPASAPSLLSGAQRVVAAVDVDDLAGGGREPVGQ
jgi:hypothetical protein